LFAIQRFPFWSNARPCGNSRSPFVQPLLGERTDPAAEYWAIAPPPALLIHTPPSGPIAAPQSPPFMPPPPIGAPRVGAPTASRTEMVSLGFFVPGCQLVLDHTLPFASIAMRPEA
jgi:hypothetical protein